MHCVAEEFYGEKKKEDKNWAFPYVDEAETVVKRINFQTSCSLKEIVIEITVCRIQAKYSSTMQIDVAHMGLPFAGICLNICFFFNIYDFLFGWFVKYSKLFVFLTGSLKNK